MKYHETIYCSDEDLWRAKVCKEHQRTVDSEVFKAFKLNKLPSRVQVIDTTWATKKKSNDMLRGRVNVRGFKQID
jgi:hypothetical protein